MFVITMAVDLEIEAGCSAVGAVRGASWALRGGGRGPSCLLAHVLGGCGSGGGPRTGSGCGGRARARARTRGCARGSRTSVAARRLRHEPIALQ